MLARAHRNLRAMALDSVAGLLSSHPSYEVDLVFIREVGDRDDI